MHMYFVNSILISSVILFSEKLNDKRMSSCLASLTRLKESDLLSSVSAEEFDMCYNDAILDPASSDRDLSDIAQQEERSFPLTKSLDTTAFSLVDWPGPQQFDVRIVEVTGKQRQNVQYSDLLQKLYIKQNHFADIELLYSGSSISTSDLSVSACLMFTCPDQAQHHVTTCRQHSRGSDGKLREALSEFVLRMSSDSLQAKYTISNSGRRFVRMDNVPCTASENLQSTTVSIKFTDLSSCPGGINRRNTALVLALTSHSGQPLGRRVIPVRICTCPKRDREKDEREERISRMREEANEEKHGGEVGEERETFWVMATSRENYETLLKVGETLEKKDGGDMVKYNEEVKKFNRSNKKRRLAKTNLD